MVGVRLVRLALFSRPALPPIDGMLSSRSSNGGPFRSVIRWRFVRSVLLSLGFGPLVQTDLVPVDPVGCPQPMQ